MGARSCMSQLLKPLNCALLELRAPSSGHLNNMGMNMMTERPMCAIFFKRNSRREEDRGLLDSPHPKPSQNLQSRVRSSILKNSTGSHSYKERMSDREWVSNSHRKNKRQTRSLLSSAKERSCQLTSSMEPFLHFAAFTIFCFLGRPPLIMVHFTREHATLGW